MELSVEFFPPKTTQAEDSFWPMVASVAATQPDFISITYGAGGSTKENSMRIAARLQQEYNIPVAMHLTCVDASCDEIDAIASQCWEMGIQRLVALRGDPKTGVDGVYKPHPNGYAYASDLILGLKKIADFDISAAAYPEKHPQATTLADDLIALKKKQDAGANRALTQFFFNNADFYHFRDLAVQQGIVMPIIPGILPIHNLVQTLKFATACGAVIPTHYHQLLSADIPPAERQILASHLFLQQCQDLYDHGVDGFHFYGMNREQPVIAAMHYLKTLSS